MPLLELTGVSKAFGGLQVISELDFHVDENEIVSVIGPNGAGKTTLFNLITGVYRPDEGDIRFEGESIVGLPPYRINQRGIARTFQNLRLFLNMTVKENVMAAAYGHTHAGVGPLDPAHAGDAARGAGDQRAWPRSGSSSSAQRLMGYRWNQPAYTLSYANRRRLEIARATATEPAAAAPRRAGRRHEPGRDARDHRADRQAPDRRRLHGPRDRARHARGRGHLRPRDRARPRDQDRRGLVRPGRDRTRRSSRRTSAGRRPPRRRRDERQRRPAARARRGRHVLRPDPHPAGALARGVPGRARLPARRQRLREVDHAEDRARDRQAAIGQRDVRGRGRDARARRATGSGRGWRSSPRTGACSGR